MLKPRVHSSTRFLPFDSHANKHSPLVLAPQTNSEFVAAGMCYEGVGGPVDHERALRLWQSSAEHGVTAAYVQLGSLYRKVSGGWVLFEARCSNS